MDVQLRVCIPASTISLHKSLPSTVVLSRQLHRHTLSFAGRENGKPGFAEVAMCRRELIVLAHTVFVGAGIAALLPSDALGVDEQRKFFTNLEDARRAGEKLRDEKEIAEGPIITLPSGVKYRELERGTGKTIANGDLVSVYYTISRLNGYYVDSTGYGKEGKNDVGDTFTFQYGKGLVLAAVEAGMEGMHVGGRRRILVTPAQGWIRADLLPLPTTDAARRRITRSIQPFLFEVELVKAK